MKTLYLGLDPSRYPVKKQLIHFPVIEIKKKSVQDLYIQEAFQNLHLYTHIVFTSKTTVKIFFEHLEKLQISKEVLKEKRFITIGPVTKAFLEEEGFDSIMAQEFTQEGIVEVLKGVSLTGTYFFYPKSKIARPFLKSFFRSYQVKYYSCDFYSVQYTEKKPFFSFNEIEEIVFTSPSTVEGFIKIFKKIPKNKKIIAIGSITLKKIKLYTSQKVFIQD